MKIVISRVFEISFYLLKTLFSLPRDGIIFKADADTLSSWNVS